MPTTAVLLTAGIVQQQDVIHGNIAPTVDSRLQQYLNRGKNFEHFSLKLKRITHKKQYKQVTLCHIALLLK